MYVIIKTGWQHGFPWFSHTIHLYWPFLLVNLLNGIQYPHRADESRFLLVGQHWCGLVKRSIWECCLWVHLYFQTCFVHLTWMVCEMRGKWSYSCCFVSCCFQELFKRACSILVKSHLVFSQGILLKSKWCNHTVILTWLQLGRIILYFIREIRFP